MENTNYEEVIEIPQPDPIAKALQHPLFLVMCILISAGCGLGLLGENFSIIQILLTIFFWIVYADSRRGIADATNLRRISGTLFASYVMNFVYFATIAILGVFVGMAICFKDVSGIWQQLWETLNIESMLDTVIIASDLVLTVIGIAVAVCCILIAIVGIILNLIGYRKFHRFAQSVYLSVGADRPIFYKPRTVHVWAIVFAAFYYISAAFSLVNFDFTQFFSDGAFGTVFLIGSIWVRKNFTNKR